MEKGTHGKDEESFEGLGFSRQTKSINGQMRVIEKSIIAHIRRAETEGRDVTKTRKVCTAQLKCVMDRINGQNNA